MRHSHKKSQPKKQCQLLTTHLVVGSIVLSTTTTQKQPFIFIMSIDASNACIPSASPLVQSTPPLPSTTRGEQCALDGATGRINHGKALLAYGSGRMVVVRSLKEETTTPLIPLVYRGHSNAVTAVKFSLSGSYVASGDARGKLRVWAYDHEEHLPKLDSNLLTGPIRDISWDMENKRVCVTK